MATRLRAAGHELRVWNRSPDKAKAWAAQGGTACSSPREAARSASQAHLMLADDTAVESTMFGPDGLMSGLSPKALVVDHSTVSVAGSKDRAARSLRGGWSYLQAPVFASPPNVLEGDGTMLIGGDKSTYDQSRATLGQILEKHFWVGEKPEDAAAYKLMGNSMLVTVVEGLAECYAIAKANGINPGRAYRLFEHFNPCGTIARRGPRMASGDYKPMFTLDMALKDVRLMLHAVGNEASAPVLKTIEAKMQQLVSQGYAKLDLAGLGVTVVPPARGGDG